MYIIAVMHAKCYAYVYVRNLSRKIEQWPRIVRHDMELHVTQKS